MKTQSGWIIDPEGHHHPQELVLDKEEKEYFFPLLEMVRSHLADWDEENPNVKIPEEYEQAFEFLKKLCDFLREKWGE